MSGPRRALVAAAILGALAVWDVVVGSLPDLPLWGDVLVTATILIPAVFGLVLLALPFRQTRHLVVVGGLMALLAVAASVLSET